MKTSERSINSLPAFMSLEVFSWNIHL